MHDKLVKLVEMRKTDCFGKTRLVLHVLESDVIILIITIMHGFADQDYGQGVGHCLLDSRV